MKLLKLLFLAVGIFLLTGCDPEGSVKEYNISFYTENSFLTKPKLEKEVQDDIFVPFLMNIEDLATIAYPSFSLMRIDTLMQPYRMRIESPSSTDGVDFDMVLNEFLTSLENVEVSQDYLFAEPGVNNLFMLEIAKAAKKKEPIFLLDSNRDNDSLSIGGVKYYNFNDLKSLQEAVKQYFEELLVNPQFDTASDLPNLHIFICGVPESAIDKEAVAPPVGCKTPKPAPNCTCVNNTWKCSSPPVKCTSPKPSECCVCNNGRWDCNPPSQCCVCNNGRWDCNPPSACCNCNNGRWDCAPAKPSEFCVCKGNEWINCTPTAKLSQASLETLLNAVRRDKEMDSRTASGLAAGIKSGRLSDVKVNGGGTSSLDSYLKKLVSTSENITFIQVVSIKTDRDGYLQSITIVETK